MATFVDTNVFIHYLLGYDPERFRQCHRLLRAAEEGRLDLETSTLVIAELIWFLERPPQRMAPADVRSRIAPLLRLSGLRLPDRELVAAALDQHANSAMNFVDAYNMVVMRRRGIERIYTYDADFDGVPGLERLDP